MTPGSKSSQAATDVVSFSEVHPSAEISVGAPVGQTFFIMLRDTLILFMRSCSGCKAVSIPQNSFKKVPSIGPTRNALNF